MARSTCTELCTKPKTGDCTLCGSLDAGDAFWRHSGLAMLGGWLANLYGYVKSPDGWRAHRRLRRALRDRRSPARAADEPGAV